jgi:hypothetical protein
MVGVGGTILIDIGRPEMTGTSPESIGHDVESRGSKVGMANPRVMAFATRHKPLHRHCAQSSLQSAATWISAARHPAIS